MRQLAVLHSGDFIRPGIGVLVLLLVSACTTVPTDETDLTMIEPQKEVTGTATGQQDSDSVQSEYIPPSRPSIELTDEILYKLLIAEFAGHRGQLDISVSNYLELARSTRDPKVIERATRIAVYARDDAATREAATLWIEIDPHNTDARQVLAIMAIREGEIEEALEHLNTLLNTTHGKIDQKLWMIANMLGREEDQEAVLTVMERLMADRQDDAQALFAYSHVMARLGNLEKSQELLEQVLVLTPDNNNVSLSYVAILQRQGKANEAIVWLEENLKKQEDDFNLRLIYARLLADTKQFDAARREFELLATQAPNNSDVLYALGLLYLQASRMDESERYFIRLTDTEQHVDEANYYLGRIAEERNELDKAGSWYQGVQKGENYFDAQIRLSLILAKQEKIEEARNHLQSVRAKTSREKSLLIQAEGELLT
ncbi:MAG TPA: tetratricopeptide repeat protein, partial [Gammaproteobacteria bacterium]